MPTVLVMETEGPANYRLERWIALFLALLFFLPFVAKADEPQRVTFNGEESTLAWRCKPTHIDGFRQCALMLDEQVLTWRMAPEGEELQVSVRFAGDLDRDSRLDLVLDISRTGQEARQATFLSSKSKQSRPTAAANVAELRDIMLR